MSASIKVEAATVEGIAAFQSLTNQHRVEVAERMQMQTFDSGDVVINQLNNENNVYFIITGRIRVCMFSNNGKEIQLDDLQPGDMFGELSAIDGCGRTSDCISLVNSKLVTLSQADFLTSLELYSGFNRYVMKRLASMTRKHIGRVFEYSAHSVRERLHFELYRLALTQSMGLQTDIVIQCPPTHADLAARISTHREAVTRELKQLESMGIITWNRRKHVIHDLIALTVPRSDRA